MANLSMITDPFIERSGEAGYRLKCPICGTDYVHHGNVAFFERPDGEDQPTHVIAPMPMPLIAFDANPSDRRTAIRIELRCEGEPQHTWFLDIIQHKGQTFLEARTPQ